MYLYISWKRQLPRAFTALFSWLPHYPPTLQISRKGLTTMYSLQPQHQLIETSLHEPLKLILPSSINSPRALAFDFLGFLPFLNLMEPLACSLCLLAILQLSWGWQLFPHDVWKWGQYPSFSSLKCLLSSLKNSSSSQVQIIRPYPQCPSSLWPSADSRSLLIY